MGEAVPEKSGAEAKAAVTLWAGMRPVATVCAEVLHPGGAVSEALATLRAQVGLLPCVHPQMLHQVRAPSKLLSTNITSEGFGS